MSSTGREAEVMACGIVNSYTVSKEWAASTCLNFPSGGEHWEPGLSSSSYRAVWEHTGQLAAPEHSASYSDLQNA